MTDYLKLMDQIDSGASDAAPSTAPVNPNSASYYLDQMNQIDGVQPLAQSQQPSPSINQPQQSYTFTQLGPLNAPLNALQGFNEQAGRAMTFGLQDKVGALVPAINAALSGGSFGEAYHKELDRERGAGETYAENNPTASKIATLVGTLGAVAPNRIAAAPTLLGRAAQGATIGGVAGFGGSNDESLSGDVIGSGLGAVFGGGVPFALEGASRIVSPQVSAAVKTLQEAGITPTPGQIMGGLAKEVEESGESVPLMGKFINDARQRAISDFNRASINKALAPIGQSLSEDTPAGNAAISEAEQKIGSVYKSILPNVTVGLDPQLQSDIQAARGIAANAGRENQFDNIIKDQVLSRFKPVGQGTSDMAMSGQEWQTAKSQLGDLIRRYASSTDADQGMLGDALSEVQASLHNGLARSNPAFADEISKANSSWALFKRLQDAAAYGGKNTEGVFTPAQLLNSVRKMDSSVDKGAFARGNALLQNFAQAGQSVLGNTVPNSGTPLRLGYLGTALLGLTATGHPAAAIGAGAGLGVGAATYSKPGVAALAYLLTHRPDGLQPIANAITKFAPPAALAAAQAGRDRLAQMINQ